MTLLAKPRQLTARRRPLLGRRTREAFAGAASIIARAARMAKLADAADLRLLPAVAADVEVEATTRITRSPSFHMRSTFPSDDTYSWDSGAGLIPPQQQIGILTYTNNTGRTVNVEMTATLHAFGSGGTGTALGRVSISAYCDDGATHLSRLIMLGSADQIASGVLHKTIADGDTINFRLYAVLTTNESGNWSAGSITWSQAAMRMTVTANATNP